jgi:hypothetical protein
VNEENKHNKKLERYGFSYERGGVHTARTMMLVELRALLSYVDKADAPRAEYLEAIQTANCLGKRSGKTRTLTYRHLVDLYALDPSLMLFRALRFFWQRDVDGPAAAGGLVRLFARPDSSGHCPLYPRFQEGATVGREAIEEFIDATKSLAASARPRSSPPRRTSTRPGRRPGISLAASQDTGPCVATPGTVSFALLLGYVRGLRGESLLKSDYTRMLDCSFDRTIELAEDASRRGWISLKRVGQVVEVLFPNLITAQEMEWLREQN